MHCALYGLRLALPATAPFLMSWVSKMGNNGLLAATIKKYLTGLKSHHIDVSCYRRDIDDVFSHGQLERMYRGIKMSQYTDNRVRKLPITKNFLILILRTLDTATVYGANYHAAFCLAFAGFLRLGEFTYELEDTRDRTFDQYHVTRQPITFSADSISLHLPASKTDPFRSGVAIPIAATDGEACPLRSLQNLYRRDPQAHDRPLFKAGNSFSRAQVNAAILECLIHAGVDIPEHAGFSFRAGAATEAKRAGMPDSDIMLLGR